MINVLSSSRRSLLLDFRSAHRNTHRADHVRRHASMMLATRPVPLAPDSVAQNSEVFSSYGLSSESSPFLLRGNLRGRQHVTSKSRAQQLMETLRQGQDSLVDVELGRYDDSSGAFNRVTMRLQQYLDWLERSHENGGKIGEQQVYLAQWRAKDEAGPGFPASQEILEHLHVLCNR